MIRVGLAVEDPTTEITIRHLLETAGCSVVDENPEVVVTDGFDPQSIAPTVVLTPMARVGDAIEAMRRGAFGYALLPLQPHEVVLMVERAANRPAEAKPFEPWSLEDIELEHINAVVRHCKGNRAKAARLLGIGRNTLWRKLAKQGRDDSSE